MHSFLQNADENFVSCLQDTQLEERIYRTDSDCVLAGRPLTEFDLYASTVVNMESAGIRSVFMVLIKYISK